jgi:nucleotide-binding universal stress UspA family protein
LTEAARSDHYEPALEPGATAGETMVTLERPQPYVVAAMDDSAGGYLAVEQAAREAMWRGWRMRIVHVQDATLRSGRRDALRTTGAELLADGSDRARVLEPALAVSTELRVGPAAGELINAAAGAGLMVVGTRGRGGFSELTTGSVAHHVAAHAESPVLIVRVPPRPSGLEWMEHPVLVGIDGSDESYGAFEFAVAEARLRGVGVVALHAAAGEWSDDVDPLHWGVLAGFDNECLGVPVRRRLVDQDPRKALVGLSAQAGAVVVAARGRGGFPGLRTGSVTQALIHQSHCPVFVIRGPYVDHPAS